MTESIKSDIRNLIFKKIEKLQREPQTLKKFFVFSIEDLNQDYEGCIQVIEDYIESHKDKILDFEFESWVDESAMIPVVMMKIHLVPSLSSHLMSIKQLNNLLPSSTESDIVREEISEILSKYSWDLNTEETRKSIMDNIKFRLDIESIEDRTSPENIDSGILNFVIKKDGLEMNINEYLDHIASEKRFE